MNVYRFTLYLEKQQDCRGWYEWFKSKDIPAAIVFRNHRIDRSDVFQYSVWREGIDNTDKYGRWHKESNILEACHGFKGGDNL